MSPLASHVAALLLGLAAGFTAGWQVHAWKTGADQADELRQAEHDRRRQAEHVDQAAVRHEAAREQLQQQSFQLDRRIDRVIDSNPDARRECLRPDSLRILHDALDGTDGDPGQLAPAVPAASAPG